MSYDNNNTLHHGLLKGSKTEQEEREAEEAQVAAEKACLEEECKRDCLAKEARAWTEEEAWIQEEEEQDAWSRTSTRWGGGAFKDKAL